MTGPFTAVTALTWRGMEVGRTTPVCLVALSAIILGLPSSAQEAEYEIPSICEGMNPVQYLGIDADGLQMEAESSLGAKLKNEKVEIIRIYCTLDVENATFAPGGCPGRGQLPISEMENGTANLVYYYTRNTPYAQAYIQIQAPTHYYSSGTLSSMVEWKASNNQTLRLAVSDDPQSRDCWMSSSDHQRKAFIHRLVNRTLTRILRTSNRDAGFLDGTLYIREPGLDTAFSRWPFPFGKEYIFESCQTSLIPLSVSLDNSSSLNYTVCSHWASESTILNWFTPQVALMLNIFYSYVCCMAFLFLWPWLYGSLYEIARRKIQEAFPWPNPRAFKKFQVRGSQRGSSRKSRKFFKGGQFPKELTVGYLLRAETIKTSQEKWTRENWTRKLIRLPYTLNPIWYMVLLGSFFVIFIVYVNVGASYLAGQRYDSKANLWSPCTHSGISVYIIVVSGLVFILVFGLIILLARDYKILRPDSESGHVQKPPNRGLQSLKKASISARSVVRVVVSILVLISLPIIIMPFVANLVLIFGFTIIGLFAFYRIYLLATLAVAKIVIFDLLKATRLNESINPKVSICKRAVDEAANQLEAEILSESAVSLMQASNPDDSTVGELHNHFGALFGAPRDRERKSILTKINASLTRAFLLLCVYAQVAPGPQRRPAAPPPRSQETDRRKPGVRPQLTSMKTELALLAEKPKGEGTDGGSGDHPDQLYSDIRHELVKGILKSFDQYFYSAIGGILTWVGVLLVLELILVHISELTSTSGWIELLLAASIFLQSIAQSLKTLGKHQDSKGELVLQAKTILLLLATELDDAEVGDGSIQILPPPKVIECPRTGRSGSTVGGILANLTWEATMNAAIPDAAPVPMSAKAVVAKPSWKDNQSDDSFEVEM